MYWCKLFQTKYDLVAAICDEKLLEKNIKTKKMKIKISKEFYGGKLIEEPVAVRIMDRATVGNLFGKEIVAVAEKNGFITKENIIVIDGIPHAQFVKI